MEKKSSRREQSGKPVGGVREASGRHLGLQEAMGLQEAHKNRCPSQLDCKSCIGIIKFTYLCLSARSPITVNYQLK